MPLSLGSPPGLSKSIVRGIDTRPDPCRWSFGSDRGQVAGELELLHDFLVAIQEDTVQGDHSTTSLTDRPPAFLVRGKLHSQTQNAG